jgi:hypothetical protein
LAQKWWQLLNDTDEDNSILILSSKFLQSKGNMTNTLSSIGCHYPVCVGLLICIEPRSQGKYRYNYMQQNSAYLNQGEIFYICRISMTRISAQKRLNVVIKLIIFFRRKWHIFLELRYVSLRCVKHLKFHLQIKLVRLVSGSGLNLGAQVK